VVFACSSPLRFLLKNGFRYSYQWVEKSIKNGRLENLEPYRAGRPSHAARPVGASGVPTRRHKVHYTLEDDQILWDWMQPYEKSGAPIMGNKIYEMLAEKVFRFFHFPMYGNF